VSESKAPTLAEVFNQQLGAASSGVRVCLPGTIKTLKNDNKADIQISVSGQRNGEDVDDPTLLSVPVLGFGSIRTAVSGPIMPGDPVLVVFGDRDLDKWKAGKGLVASKAGSPRQHDLTDCLAIPILVGSTTSVELWAAFAGLVARLSTSTVMAPGAPQDFDAALIAFNLVLTAQGIVPRVLLP
jgi:hypothetical protein